MQFAKSKENCALDRFEGNEKNREKFLKNLENEEIRKVLVKFDVEEIERFESLDELVEEFLKGFKLLIPFYLKTKEI